jgi:hypothetical protein
MENNTLPESIKKRIQDEAEASYPLTTNRFGGAIDDYNRIQILLRKAHVSAAEAILSNLEAWGLAGVWLNCKDKLPDKDGLYIIEHKNGGRWQMFFKTEDRKWYWQPNPYSVCGDGFIERWLSVSATPSDRVQQLEQGASPAGSNQE